ncbi:glycosyltransferase family 4 protein [Comamonadaceae bacterium OTU4NAUVB1]|nr:glycosyltransferase family 4 protein [Comamonadaceae bacterium OTU4NAUVB1]
MKTKNKKIKILGITQGADVPSTRFRWSQYGEDLISENFEVSEAASKCGAYPPASHGWRPVWFGAACVENLGRVFRSNKFDLTFLQRNLISTLFSLESMIKKPFVFDVDDAIFLGARGKNANRIARISSLTICGNNFLANHFADYGSVVVLPTAVDASRFVPLDHISGFQKVIGWSGSSSGFKYLYEIEPAISKILKKYPDSILKIVSDKAPLFKSISSSKVVYEPWSVEREVAVLQEFSVGIMPLENSLWARGKCSFKMLTYMSVGIPVVVSPVGMNSEVLAQAHCGFGPRNHDEWVDSISSLLENPTLSKSMGACGRKLIETNYSKKVIGPKLSLILKSQI